MDYTDVFKRYEIKYLITGRQRGYINQALAQHAKADKYGHSIICNVYYDTPDFHLIRRSIEKPIYKEKLRVRSYGLPKDNGKVFVELKKKYRSVTYKRRTDMTALGAENWLLRGGAHPDCQIAREIDYTLKLYKNLAPAVFISYEREAFAGVEESDFRVTFDHNILWRADNLAFSGGIYGSSLLPQGLTLMEVKTPGAMPLWFTQVLTDCKIYSTHFSKYGNAYQALCAQKDLPEMTTIAAVTKYPAAAGGIIYA